MSIQTTKHPLPDLPSVGCVPERMLTQVIRQDRLGEPRNAFVIEEMAPPTIKADEVLVAVMAAGINFKTCGPRRAIPIDVIGERQRVGDARDFHVGGSHAGIICPVGADVPGVAVGDEVLIHHGWWKRDDPLVVPTAIRSFHRRLGSGISDQ